jgi:hypothetical protein
MLSPAASSPYNFLPTLTMPAGGARPVMPSTH